MSDTNTITGLIFVIFVIFVTGLISFSLGYYYAGFNIYSGMFANTVQITQMKTKP